MASNLFARIDELNQEAWKLRYSDQHASGLAAQEAFSQSETLDYERGKAYARLNLAVGHFLGRLDRRWLVPMSGGGDRIAHWFSQAVPSVTQLGPGAEGLGLRQVPKALEVGIGRPPFRPDTGESPSWQHARRPVGVTGFRFRRAGLSSRRLPTRDDSV